MRISEDISVHLGHALYRSVKADKSVNMDGVKMVETGIEAYDNDKIIGLLVNKGFLVAETVDKKQIRESIYG